MQETLPTETVETTATPTEATEVSNDTPQTYEDVWSQDLPTLTQPEPTAEAERAESDAPNPSDVSPSAESAEEKEEVKEEEPKEADELETLTDGLTDDEREAMKKLPNPARVKLRQLQTLTDSIIKPFRDIDTPINTFFDALRELNPHRAEQLVNTVVQESATSYPNEWLKVILGDENATVESVKQALQAPSAPSSAATTQSDPILQKVVSELDDLYGENWRTDDSLVLEEDLEFVNEVRAKLNNQSQSKQVESEEIAKLKAELAETKPQIEQILTAQEKAQQDAISSSYEKWSGDYEKSIESAVLPSIYKSNGLEDNPNDTEKVKLVKAEARARFENKSYGGQSDFERFLLHGFSQKENVTKIINRVAVNGQNAIIAEIKANNEKDAAKAAQLRKDAQAFQAEADREKDVITVLTKNASKEFLKATSNSSMSLLEENTQLRQQLAKLTGGRTELVGQAVAGGGIKTQIESFADEGKNPFDFDLSQLASGGR